MLVVGGGFAGIATAVRAARQGHEVTVLERSIEIGGSLRRREQDGFGWDPGPTTTALPAVLRDLFRTSGRPLERVLDLVAADPGRRHVFPDGAGVPGRTVLDLPMGGRGAQVAAVEAALGAGASWGAWVDDFAPVWEALRRTALETPFGGLPRADRRRLPLRPLSRHVRRLADPRLRTLVLDRVLLDGHDPTQVPAVAACTHYVERTFGRWRFDGGVPALLAALEARLAERRVEVRTECTVRGLVVRAGRAAGVELAAGAVLPADRVVWAADPRPLARWLPRLQRVTPVLPVRTVHVGLGTQANTRSGATATLPDLPDETYWHGDADEVGGPLVVRTGGSAPAGARAWTVLQRGGSEDPLVALARRGLNLRAHVLTRLDLTAADQVTGDRAATVPPAWRGWRSGLDRPRPDSGVPGLHCVGAAAHPGPGLPLTGLGAAQAAELLGRVQRAGR